MADVKPSAPAAAGMAQIHLEALDHQVRWDSQVDALELQGDYLREEQLRCMRMQMSATLREVSQLRDDVAALRHTQVSVEERIAGLNTEPRETPSEPKASANDVLSLRGELERLQSSIMCHTDQQKQELEDLNGALGRRMDFLEQLLVSSQDSSSPSVSMEDRGLQAVFDGRLSDLEAMIRDSTEKQASLTRTQALQTKDMDALRELHTGFAALRERCDGLTSVIGKFGEARSADQQAVRDALTRHAQDIGTLTASCARITGLEDSVERNTDEMQAMRSTLTRSEEALHRVSKDVTKTSALVDDLAGRELRSLKDFCEKNRLSLEDVKQQQAIMHNSIKDSEAVLAESTERHTKEMRAVADDVSAVKEAQARLADGDTLRAMSAEQQSVAERLRAVEQEMADHMQRGDSRLASLERVLEVDEERGAHRLQALSSTVDRIQAELDERHARIELSVATVDESLARELRAVRSELGDTSLACADQVAALKAACQGQEDAFSRSVTELEGMLHEQSRELATLELNFSKLHSQAELQTQDVGVIGEACRGLEEGMRQQADRLEELWRAQQGQRRDLDDALGDVRAAVDGEWKGRLEAIEADLTVRFEGMDVGMRDLRDTLAGEVQVLTQVRASDAEAVQRQLQELKSAMAKSAGAAAEARKEREEELRAECVGAADRAAQEVAALRRESEAQKKSMEALQKSSSWEEHLKKSETSLKHMIDTRRKELWSHCSALGKRMDGLESASCSASEKLADAMKVIKDVASERSQKFHTVLSDIQALKEANARRGCVDAESLAQSFHGETTALARRLDAVEQSARESPMEMAQALECLQNVQARFETVLNKEVGEVTYIKEMQLKHSREIAALSEASSHLKDELHTEARSLKSAQAAQDEALQKAARDVGKIREAQAKQTREVSTLSASRQHMVGLVDRHTVELEVLRLTQAEHDEAAKQRGKELGDLRDAHARQSKALGGVRAQLSALGERLAPLESNFGSLSLRLNKELRALRDSHSSQEEVGSMVGRVSAELEAMRADMDQNSRRFETAMEQTSSGQSTGTLSCGWGDTGGQLTSDEDRPGGIDTRCSERLDALEAAAASGSKRTAEELAHLREAQTRCSTELERCLSEVAGLREELDGCPSTGGGGGEFAGRLSKVEGTVAEMRSDRESLGRTLADLGDAVNRGGVMTERLSKELVQLWTAAEMQSVEMNRIRASVEDGSCGKAEKQAAGESRCACSADVGRLRDALSKLAAAVGGDADTDFVAFRKLFREHARSVERLANFEHLFEDHGFYAVLPERFRCLERKTMELMGHNTAEVRRSSSASKSRRDVVVRGHSAPHRSSSVEGLPSLLSSSASGRSMSVTVRQSAAAVDGLRLLQNAVAASVALINERKNIHYDPRLRRATFLKELTMKRRFFGSDHVDEPTAEWADDTESQPMLGDIAFLFDVLTSAAKEQNGDNKVSATVVRCRNRLARRASDLVRNSLISQQHGVQQNASPLSMMDRAQAAQQWELDLARNRVTLLAETLVNYGVPQALVDSKVDDGPQDVYFVEFNFRLF